MNRPPLPPDVALIRLARTGARISAVSASRAAGMSKSRWVQIENGYEKRRGQERPARAKPVTIARMAHAVSQLGASGVTPERLESEGRNPEAAAVLREILRQQQDRPAVLPLSPEGRLPILDDPDEAGLLPYLQGVRGALAAAVARHGFGFTGAQAFTDPLEVMLWDTVPMTGEQKERLIARLRRFTAEGPDPVHGEDRDAC